MNSRISHHKIVMALRTSIISHYGSLSAMFTLVRIKNCSKSMPVIKVASMKNMDGAMHPTQLLSETEISIALLCQLCSTY